MDAMIERGTGAPASWPLPPTWRTVSRHLPTAVRAEQRRAQRRRTDLPGYLALGEGEATVTCKVCNLSATGALIRLQVLPTSAVAKALPDRFTLVLTHYKQETHIECLIVRHTSLDVGVRFVGQFQTVKRARSAASDAARR